MSNYFNGVSVEIVSHNKFMQLMFIIIQISLSETMNICIKKVINNHIQGIIIVRGKQFSPHVDTKIKKRKNKIGKKQ